METEFNALGRRPVTLNVIRPLRETKIMSQRIPGINVKDADARASAVLNAQSKKWGSPLINHLVYARIPSIFKAVRGMWSGLNQSGLLPQGLLVLVNRRVAILNNCEF